MSAPDALARCLGLALVVGAAIGCDAPAEPPPDMPEPPTLDGARIYAEQCASCHGEVGQGGLGTRLIDWPGTLESLREVIDARMPQDAPARCTGACATSVASYILARFTSAGLACDEVPPSPRRLRLLTRREYAASVRQLLSLPSDEGDPAPTCGAHTFVYDAGGRTLASVHVAGSFNEWSTSAWPLSFDRDSGLWTSTRTLEDGVHQYKLVLDGGEWVRDVRNPDTAPDGFGGENSVLRVRCASGGGAVFDPAAGLPPDARPHGFLFDGEADAAFVSALHVDEYLAAAARSVEAARASLSDLAACESGEARDACTSRFVTRFGRRAFRRPLDASEAARYASLAAAQPSLERGVEAVVRAMLVSPFFLYRSELGAPSGDHFELDAFERATALSFQLWGSPPDDALLDAAASGALMTPAGLESEARRLLADARARRPVGEFAVQWLGVAHVADETRQRALYPDFDAALGGAMREEARRFVTSVVFDGSHSLRELLTSTDGFANASLARVYGVSGPSGASLEPFSHADGAHAGVLTLAAVMTAYAHSDQTSPIQRGLFVRQNLLCQEFPPPPPDAGGVPDVDPSATTRERFAQHTSEARCAGCHRYIDPIGFGFERFDAIGATRSTEGGAPIDASGDMVDVEGLGSGTSAPFTSVPQLAETLASSSAASECFVRQYFRFARGYRESAEDRCAIESLRARFEAHADVRELMIDVVLSPDFVRRRDASTGGAP